MIFSVPERYIFIHIPKTAGTSLSHAMKNCNKCSVTPFTCKDAEGVIHTMTTHSTARDISRAVGRELFEKYLSFSVVRNPWDRLVSFYYFKILSAKQRASGSRRQRSAEYMEREQQEIEQMLDLGFNNWVLSLDSDIQQYAENEALDPQVKWVCDDAGQLMVTRVLYYENLARDVSRLAGKISMQFSPIRGNSSKHEPWWQLYDEDAFEFVKTRYAEDLEAFNYQYSWGDVLRIRAENKPTCVVG